MSLHRAKNDLKCKKSILRNICKHYYQQIKKENISLKMDIEFIIRNTLKHNSYDL